MLALMLGGLALAADAPFQVQETETSYVILDAEGELVDAAEFARLVGDDEALFAYRGLVRNQGTWRRAAVGGGPPAVFVGGAMFLIAAVQGPAAWIVLGPAVAVGGVAVMVTGGSRAARSRDLATDPATFWSYPQAEQWVGAYNLGHRGRPSVRLHQGAMGLEARHIDEPLSAMEFAWLVGDDAGYERIERVRRRNRIVGGALVVPGVPLTLVASPVGCIPLLGGAAVLGFGRVRLDPLDRWYTEEEAEAWIAGPAED